MTSQEVPNRIPTPFAQHSWEPRFAFDGRSRDIDLIQTGLSCALVMDPFHAHKTDRRFIAYSVSSTRLAIKASNYHSQHPLSETTQFADASIEDAARAISTWLESKTVYPDRPWFDGGESRGFQMFHVPYCSQYSAYKGYFGYTLVEPKWFEVHK